MPPKKKASDVPVFRPSADQLEGSFEAYIESIERKFAGPGICKIIPPKGWTPRKKGYNSKLDFEFQPIRQISTGSRGVYRMLLLQGKPQSLSREFRPTALAKENLAPKTDSAEDLERHYWRSLTLKPPQYGADVEGSLFDRSLKGWNLRRLDSLLSRTLKKHKLSLPGCSTPYLYFGMWRSTFAWHTEDVDLASVNYLHYGAPKSWYCIPPAHRGRFERLLQGMVPELFRDCHEFLRHKEILVSPELLRIHSIPVIKVIQYPGEFIINFPGVYHSGFNHGYNCAESTNFATRAWIETGARARHCDCNSDSVKIQMSLFLDAASPAARQAILDNECSSSESESDSEEEESCASGSDASRRSGTSGPARARQAGSKSRRRMAAQPEDSTASASASSCASSKAGAEAASQSQRKRQRQPDSDESTAERAEKRQKAAAARTARALSRAQTAGHRQPTLPKSARTLQLTGARRTKTKPGLAAMQRAAVRRPARYRGSGSKPAAAASKVQRVAQAKAGVQKPGGVGQRPRAAARGVLAHLSSIFMALRSQSRHMRHMRCQKRPT